jgi:Flp pilus assembly protein TadG
MMGSDARRLRRTVRDHDERGAAAVEFALGVLVLLTLVFGIIEFSRAIWTQQALNAASREASRFGIGNETSAGGAQYLDCAGIRDRAKARVPDIGLSDADITITYLHTDGSTSTCGSSPSPAVRDGDRIRVQVTTTLDLVMPLVPLGPIAMDAADERSIYNGIRP